MSPFTILIVAAAYFLLLLLVSWFSNKGADSRSFYTGNRTSPWYLVAIGMIGASLSGVTFVSVPGEVMTRGWGYFQLVLGYLLGYWIIAKLLLPMYYAKGLISIYSYLGERFGPRSYKGGSAFFLLSQWAGASLRLFLVASVLQYALYEPLGIPFWVNVGLSILGIWIYTYRSGIRTVVRTDVLQTVFMLLAVIFAIFSLLNVLDLSLAKGLKAIATSETSIIWDWNWRSESFVLKQFFSGAFIAVVMTGLDQNMMQKNLSCRNLKEAQKNMAWFAPSLLPVNLLFLALGSLLVLYAQQQGIALPTRGDDLFPMIALNELGSWTAAFFILGIIAAAYSSADSSLTALTTAFCTDFLGLKMDQAEHFSSKKRGVHIVFSLAMFVLILVFEAVSDGSVISLVFTVAGYTYGPLLGLFAVGMFTDLQIQDSKVAVVMLLSPLLSHILATNAPVWFNGYRFGYELLLINGLFTAVGLWMIRTKKA